MHGISHITDRKSVKLFFRRIGIMFRSNKYLFMVLCLCSAVCGLPLFFFGVVLLPLAMIVKFSVSFAVFYLGKDLSRGKDAAMYCINLGISKRWLWTADIVIFSLVVTVSLVSRGWCHDVISVLMDTNG